MASVDTKFTSEQILKSENASLRSELAALRGQLNSAKQASIGSQLVESRPASYLSSKKESGNSEGGEADLKTHLSIVVLGASGDLAVKKTYPALFALYRHNLMPKNFTIIGYARSDLKEDEFKEKIAKNFPKEFVSKKANFLENCSYQSGQYDSEEDFGKLDAELSKRESKYAGDKSGANRMFYMAIPPNAFVPAAKSIHAKAMSKKGWNRIVVEKPFGRDLESSQELGRELGALFSEDQIFRIDHFLGKEMVQNLMTLRFANRVFEPLWNRDHINCVQINFKEDFGTQGRAGFFDPVGIIRDVMQNHMLQMLSIVAMEPPLSLSAEDVRDEKVKLLRSTAPITPEDTVTGQYTADPKGKEKGYLDDKDVPKDSLTPTYATTVMHINNSRWMGVPFIMRCGKALNEKKTEIRIQFKYPVNTLFDDMSPNELVLRVGPDEAVYLKMTTKEPGLDGKNAFVELDLSYESRFKEQMRDMPDAYERLILDVIRGDHSLFVRSDELTAAWRIFTPLLHAIDKDRKVKPHKYEFGSRGPPEADKLVEKYGFVRNDKYKWNPDAHKKKDGSSGSGASRPHEPEVLSKYVKAIESSDEEKEKQLADLFTDDAMVETPQLGSKLASEFWPAWLKATKGVKFLSKHKFLDPHNPRTTAIYFTAIPEGDDGKKTAEVVDILELDGEGKKIRKLVMLSDPRKLGSKL